MNCYRATIQIEVIIYNIVLESIVTMLGLNCNFDAHDFFPPCWLDEEERSHHDWKHFFCMWFLALIVVAILFSSIFIPLYYTKIKPSSSSPIPIPTPVPTLTPSSSPSPTPSPTPLPTQVPTLTPSDSLVPTPVPAPTPTPAPTPSASPVPTPTPIPTSAQVPTLVPAPIPTPAPTLTPTPTQAPTPVPTPTLAPTPIATEVNFCSYAIVQNGYQVGYALCVQVTSSTICGSRDLAGQTLPASAYIAKCCMQVQQLAALCCTDTLNNYCISNYPVAVACQQCNPILVT